MNNAPTINIVTNVAEDKSPVFFRPFYVGDQIYIVAQQNMERIEHSVSFSFGLLTARGDVIPTIPSQQGALLSLLMRHFYQCGYNTNFVALPPTPPMVEQEAMEWQNGNDQKNDRSPFHFTCTRSTSTSELTSQDVDIQPHGRNAGKYFVLEVHNPDSKSDEGLRISVECTEDRLRLNAREKLKHRKSQFDDEFD